MQREIVLDTETTGLDPYRGDRLVEIGCVELANRVPTGREFHCYINPQRDMPAEAEAVHGLSAAFLADKPLFSAVAKDFLAFIGEATLVIHNAAFDVGFLNAELSRLNLPAIRSDRVVDTLALARRKHPGAPTNLDALCKRYRIDNSKRIKHGALMDSLLLAEVYIELLGERQAALGLEPVVQRGPGGGAANGHGAQTGGPARTADGRPTGSPVRTRPAPLPARLTAADLETHTAFIAALGDKALWKRHLG